MQPPRILYLILLLNWFRSLCLRCRLSGSWRLRLLPLSRLIIVTSHCERILLPCGVAFGRILQRNVKVIKLQITSSIYKFMECSWRDCEFLLVVAVNGIYLWRVICHPSESVDWTKSNPTGFDCQLHRAYSYLIRFDIMESNMNLQRERFHIRSFSKPCFLTTDVATNKSIRGHQPRNAFFNLETITKSPASCLSKAEDGS